METFESSLFLVTDIPPSHVSESDLRPLFYRADGRESPAGVRVDINSDTRSAFVTVDSRGELQWTASKVALGNAPLNVQQLCLEAVSLELTCADSWLVRMTKTLAENLNLNLLHVSEDAIAVKGSFAKVEQLRADLIAYVLKTATSRTQATHSSSVDRLMETGQLHAAKTYELDVDLVAEMAIALSGLNQDVLRYMAKVPEGNIEGAQYNPSAGEVVLTKPTIAEVDLCRTKVMSLYQSLLEPSPTHVRTASVDVPLERDALAVATIIAKMNEQHSRCVLYLDGMHHVKIVSNAVQELCLAKEQLQSLLSIPSTDTLNLQGGKKLTIKKGNIESENATAIVCPSNSRLQHNSGVALCINAASQCSLQKKSEDIMQKCEPLSVGNIVMISAGGALKCKYVYHIILPDTTCGPRTSYAAVQDMMVKVLGYAEKHNIQSIALPLFTSEVFSDENVVGKLMVESVVDYIFTSKLPVLSDIVICVARDADFIFLTRYLYQKMSERKDSRQSYDSSTVVQSIPGSTPSSMPKSAINGSSSYVALPPSAMPSPIPPTPGPSPFIPVLPSDSARHATEVDSCMEDNLKLRKLAAASESRVCPICKMTLGSGVVTTACCHQTCCQDCWKKSTKLLNNKCPFCKRPPEAITVAYSAHSENNSLKFTDTRHLQYHHFKDYW